MSSPERSLLAQFWTPRYWLTWMLWGWLRGTARLPLVWQLRLGRRAGRLLRSVRSRERRAAQRNLEICFPDLAADERLALLARHFEALGMSLAEMAIGWFWPIERLLEIVEVRGREHLGGALAKGKGVILLTAHFTTLEIGAAMLEELCPRSSGMYRPQHNPLLDAILRRGRSRFAKELVARSNVRGLLRKLRDNHAVLYLPDQTYPGNQSELLPFFGEPAVTNTAVSRLARISGAAVLPYFFRRRPDDSGYVIDIGAPLEGFPSRDAALDTRRTVALLEDYIRLAPEQYLWVYKKFKGRPAPYPNVYS